MGADITSRVRLLQRVSIFAETPAEQLAQVAALLDEKSFSTGEVVFQKGDPGSCVYIIASGKVLVHDGDMPVNQLQAGEIFGEMAVLDPQPRSASVTALEPAHLYRLERLALYKVMAGQPDILPGIVRILSQRLRKQMQERAVDFEYIRQFNHVIDAANAVEAGVYESGSLNQVAQRTDELGHLARVFQHMASEVYNREQRLKQQVAELRIEIDEVKRSSQVAEITETEYFQGLQQKAEQLRQKRGRQTAGNSA